MSDEDVTTGSDSDLDFDQLEDDGDDNGNREDNDQAENKEDADMKNKDQLLVPETVTVPLSFRDTVLPTLKVQTNSTLIVLYHSYLSSGPGVWSV